MNSTSTTDLGAAHGRAADLLARMTLPEKVAQLTGMMAPSLLDDAVRHHRLRDGVGHIATIQMAGAGGAAAMASLANSVQRHLVEHTRLGIPAIVHNEALNGVIAPGFTSFPTPIGLAATWDPEEIQRMAETIRMQMRALGQHQALSPVVDVARDARWGRVHETYGEDVLLTSEMGVAFVRGVQGDDLRTGVVATAKHFLAYAASEAALNTSGTSIGIHELYDVHAAPFEALITHAGLESVMNSYAEIDGSPVLFDPWFIREMLRGHLAFPGTVVSDYTSLQMLVRAKRAAADADEAGRLSLQAGLDVELPEPFGYGDALVAAVRAGTVDEGLVTEAAGRVLEQKARLGIFDRPYVDDSPIVIDTVARQGRDLAAHLADLSVTLLKNDGVLPLGAQITKIAVVGPHAQSVASSFANYTFPATVQTLQGMMTGTNRMVGVEGGENFELAPDSSASHALGAIAAIDPERSVRELWDARSLAEWVAELRPDADVRAATVTTFGREEEPDLEEAVELAHWADVVVLAIGGRSGGAGWDLTEGEGTDSTSLELPAGQIALADAVAASGTPLVTALWAGRGYVLPDSVLHSGALLTAYYGGPEGPRALARVVLGETNPAGRLPFTMPRATGQVPIHHAQAHGSGYHRADADGYAGYIDESATPRFAFGHGLSYTEFVYGGLTVEQHAEHLALEIEVTNCGQVEGDEVVQFYADVRRPGRVGPAQQLVAFRRISLRPGERADVAVSIPLAQLSRHDSEGRFTLHPGVMALTVGGSSVDVRASASVTISGHVREFTAGRAVLPETTWRVTSPEAASPEGRRLTRGATDAGMPVVR